MTVASDLPVDARTRPRIQVFDGLRGVAVVLVILSHGWTIWPNTWVEGNDVVRPWFASGNFAVSIFFVIGAFLAVSAMLRERDRTGTLRFGVFWARRWIRISAHVYVLVVAVLALTAMDKNMNVYAFANTRDSAWHIVTYTWTQYVSVDPIYARPDLGHLWYVCTDIWGILLLAFLTYAFGRNRALLFGIVAAIAVVVMVYRHHVFVTEGEFQALIRITTRIDSMLWGALAAIALPWLGRFREHAPRYAALALVALLPIMYLARSNEAYFGYAGVLLNVTMFVFVVAASLAEPGRRVQQVLGSRLLQVLGIYSFTLYLWHYPIFWYLSRNYYEWNWVARTAVGLLATIVISVVTQRVIERPLQRALKSPEWTRATETGMVPYLAARAKARISRAAPRAVAAKAEPTTTDVER